MSRGPAGCPPANGQHCTALNTSNHNTQRSQRTRRRKKSHAKTRPATPRVAMRAWRKRRKEKRDFEQELTEVTEFSVSSLSSCVKILCLRCPRTRKKGQILENRGCRCVCSSLFKSAFVLNLCAFASLADVAKGGDGAKSALRQIFSVFMSFYFRQNCKINPARGSSHEDFRFCSQFRR